MFCICCGCSIQGLFEARKLSQVKSHVLYFKLRPRSSLRLRPRSSWGFQSRRSRLHCHPAALSWARHYFKRHFKAKLWSWVSKCVRIPSYLISMSNHKERGKKLPCGFGPKRDKICQVVIDPFAMLTTFQESRWLGKSSRWEYQCHRQGPLPPLLGNLLAKITPIEK